MDLKKKIKTVMDKTFVIIHYTKQNLETWGDTRGLGLKHAPKNLR